VLSKVAPRWGVRVCLAAAGLILALALPLQAQMLPRPFNLPLPLFSSDSAWNQSAAGAQVLAQSDQQILALYRVLLGDHSWLNPPGPWFETSWPFMDVNYDHYSIPIFGAGPDQQTVVLQDYLGQATTTNPKLPPGPGGSVTVPAPAGTVRPSGPQGLEADGHLILYDSDSGLAYDFWQATTALDESGASLGGGQTGSLISMTGAVDYFDLAGNGANPATYFSARATGTPLLAGLILPEDVAQGAIGHALAFALPGPRNTNLADPYEPIASDYFYPAATTATDFYSTDPKALAAGQRIRLKSQIVDQEGNVIDETGLKPITRMFLAALRNYGAYLVDGAGGFSFYAEDIHTAVLDLSDDQVNQLVGQPAGAPLAEGKTKWQMVMEGLNLDLELIPLAAGPWQEGQDPASATISAANFEVVEPALGPDLE